MTDMMSTRKNLALLLGASLVVAACSKSEEEAPINTAVPAFYTEFAEGLPAEADARVTAFERQLREAATEAAAQSENEEGFGADAYSSVIIRDYYRWDPGSTVTVAFLGGTPQLREQIERLANEWVASGVANLKFSFRYDEGNFREWSPSDQDYRADIRIAFARNGNWSFLGNMSREPKITRAGQPSMNLGGFTERLPANWKRVVLHEFGHALGFAHEHSHPAVECGFRFEDDPGYVRTTNGANGPFIPDSNGKRPGLYTWFSGPPNIWNKAKVDNNLKAIGKTSAYSVDDFDTMEFDPLSIMKYHFGEEYFINGKQSKCYTPTHNEALSARDKMAAARAYDSNSLASMIDSLEALSDAKAMPTAIQRNLADRVEALSKATSR